MFSNQIQTKWVCHTALCHADLQNLHSLGAVLQIRYKPHECVITSYLAIITYCFAEIV